jgi:Flp pilus assembly protein TadD
MLALLATTAIAAIAGGCTQTGGLFSREPKLAATDSIGAVAKWSSAYAKDPQDPKVALGYARSLKNIGSRDRALEILVAGYRANPADGELSAELGRLALDMGRMDIATQALKTAEARDVRDWRTLSAQGTLRAKQGSHAEAQQYFLAALQEKPDAVSVINNLALSYALDGKAKKSEELLRKAVASGHDDKRVRQNLALVLGLQGKFEEARQVASVDMTQGEAQSNVAYLQNMLSQPTQFAAGKAAEDEDDWAPFAEDSSPPAPPSGTAALTPPGAPKLQVVRPTEEEIKPPALASAGSAVQANAEAPAPTGGSSSRAKSVTAQTAPSAPMDILRAD